jgi:hypothetical protein
MMEWDELVTESHALIDIALILDPEGEGVDLADREYTVDDIVALKGLMGSMRKGIDIVSGALAQVWHQLYPEVGGYSMGGQRYYLAPNKRTKWQSNEAGVAFAVWLTEQDPKLVERIVPAYGVRIGSVPDEARATFFDERPTDDNLRIQSREEK